jgi:hypothetical protein
MKPLEQMSFAQRFLLTIVIVLIVLFALALTGYLGGRWEAQAKVAIDCFEATERERVRDISLRAIDVGLEQAVAHLYSIWTKDPESEQPKRAQVGVTNALNAHSRARKFALAWDPPACSTEK